MDKVNATGHVPTKKCVQFLATTLLGLSLCSVTFAQVVKPVYVSYYYVPFEKRPSVIQMYMSSYHFHRTPSAEQPNTSLIRDTHRDAHTSTHHSTEYATVV